MEYWNNGSMEVWNDGIMEFWVCLAPILPLFQSSNIPLPLIPGFQYSCFDAPDFE